MKRLAILCNYKLIPERIGGMDYFFKAYNEALLDLNYKVDWFFSTGEQHEFYKAMPLNIANSDTVEAFFYDKFRETDVTYDFIITHFVELCTKWFKRFKNRYPDSKIIAVDHNPRPFNGYSFSKQIKKKLKGVLYSRYTDLFVGVSDYTCRHILNDFGYLLRNKIITVYNGVVTNNIDFRKSIQDNNCIRFIVISHLRKSKGIQDLIEALNFLSENEIRHLKIDVYGEGPYEIYLESLVKKYNLEAFIDFKGSSSSLKSLIKNYDFMIQPTYMECFSLSILESLAANVPVITTPVGGNLEVISNGVNGFIHEVSDVKALSLIIRNIISKELTINNATRPLIENKFSIDTMVKKSHKIFRLVHIGYITSEYPHSRFDFPVGGIGTFTKTIAEALVTKGYRVSVFIHSQEKDEMFNENGVEIYHVKTYRIKGLTWMSNRFHFNRVLNKIIKAQGINLIEVAEWTGFTAGMQFKCPLVLRLHGSDTFFCDLEGRKLKFKNKLFEKLSLLGATKIIGVSAFVATRTKSLFNLKNDIEVVYNGVDTSSLVPDHSKIVKGSVLYFGSIIRKKGVLELAKAFNKVVEDQPGTKLYYLGRDVVDYMTGRSTLTLVKEILTAKAHKNFIYLGTKPYSEVQEVIKTKEIVVLPSHAEAFPMSWLEAMALEKKMVTSNIGWANELMVDKETGLSTHPNNITKLSELILQSLKSNSNEMPQRARKHILENFNFESLLNKNINLYKSVINGN